MNHTSLGKGASRRKKKVKGALGKERMKKEKTDGEVMKNQLRGSYNGVQKINAPRRPEKKKRTKKEEKGWGVRKGIQRMLET